VQGSDEIVVTAKGSLSSFPLLIDHEARLGLIQNRKGGLENNIVRNCSYKPKDPRAISHAYLAMNPVWV